MRQAPLYKEGRKIDMLYGQVKMKDDNFFWVETDEGVCKAIKSVSCLIEPLIFDEVLLSSDHNEKSYILSVLEREKNVKSNLVFDGDVSFEVRRGDLEFNAQSVCLSGEHISMTSKELDISSLNGKARIHDFTFLGNVFSSQVNSIKIIAKTMHSVIERLTQKVKRSYRWIESLEQIKAGRLSYFARESIFLKGKRSSLLAEKKVKIDAEKIHLG